MLWASTSEAQGPYLRRYVGQFIEDERNGKGEMTYPNGDQYTGKIYDPPSRHGKKYNV